MAGIKICFKIVLNPIYGKLVMNFKKIALAAAAAAAATPAMAADLPVVAEPVNYVEACTVYGNGYFKLPGQDTCIRVHGQIRTQWTSHDLTEGLGDVTKAGKPAVNAYEVYSVDTTTNTGTTLNVYTIEKGDYSLGTAAEAAAARATAIASSAATQFGLNPADSKDAAKVAAAIKVQEDIVADAAASATDKKAAQDKLNAHKAAVEATDKAIASAREVSAKVEDTTNDYTTLARGYLFLESMTATELMTIKTYTEFTASWNEGSSDTVGIGSAYVQLGFDNVSVLFGRTGSIYDAFGGYSKIGVIGVAEGGDDPMQISVAASMGNGFSAEFGITDANVYGGASNRVNLEGILSMTQGMFSGSVSGAAHAYSDSDYGYAVAGTVEATPMENVTIGFGASYAQNAVSFVGGAANSGFTDGGADDLTGYALAGGVKVGLTDKLTAALDGSFAKLEKGNADYDYTVVNGSITYNPVAGMDVVLDAGWMDDSAGNDTAKVAARLQYAF